MKLLFCLTFRKIKKSLGRFFSILLIVALGVGFFAGLRETTPDIITTLDDYYDETNLMDYKITSTKGLVEDDIEELKKLQNVDKVIPSYSTDVLVSGDAIRVHALLSLINQVTLVDGRMPTSKDECVADSNYYNVGDVIEISKVSVEGILDTLKYKVVGTVKSSLYIAKEKGIATIGNGKLESFIFVLEENFTSEIITEVYLTSKNSKDEIAYTNSYNQKNKDLEEELLKLKPIQETKRYEEILETATKKIQKIESEFNKEKQKAEIELKTAKEKIDNSRKQLDQGWADLDKAKQELNQNETNGKLELENAKKKLEDGKNTYQQTLVEYDLKEAELESLLTEVKDEINNLTTSLLELDENDPNYLEIKTNLEILKGKEELLTNLLNTKEELRIAEENLLKEEENYLKQIMLAKESIEKGELELKNGELSYKDGLNSYNEGVKTLDAKTKDAMDKIVLAKKSLNEIEKPEWYLLTRTSNNGYTSIYDDAIKVDSIAKIFPVFFILVVALMCFNSLNRMVEEERGEIGIFSSLGYKNISIMTSYLLYVFLATIIGVTIGLLIGYTVIPKIIYQIYHANYILPDLEVEIKIIPFLILVISSLSIMFLITILSCQKELKNNPATILRPKAPKNGKKVLLEKVTFIWKKLSFTSKVTVRNMFRYKKRIIMTVLGIAGSTALLLTGFGLRDSINELLTLQYGNIINYDALLVFQDNYQELDDDSIKELQTDGIKELMPIYQESFTFDAKDISHDVYLTVLSDTTLASNFVTFNNKVNSDFVFPNDGVIITEKMAKLLDVSVGDLIKIRNNKNELYLLTVSDIVENYTLHYIYMSESVYEKVFEREVSYNMIMANLVEDINQENLATKWIDKGVVSTINFTSDNFQTFSIMIASLNKLVYLIIVASCLLTFVVLYNLTAVNIAERIREISTLKVLGFYDKEVSNYVYRETLMLTIFGILFGLVLGIFLHRFVMDVAETDNILFLHSIKWISFVLSSLIIVIFGIIVQLFTHFKLKKIDMIESLKSVE